MKSITIHGLDETMDKLIRQKAQSHEMSLNKTIKELLRESLGISKKHAKKNRFDKFYGIWSKKEGDEFDKIIEEEFETIDEEEWK